MRIRRVRVGSYGPLEGLELELVPGLNVVYGPNEAGKTALVDFLLGQLFRWESRTGTQLPTVLPGVHRFGDPATAEGSIELRLGRETHRYPGAPSLFRELRLEYAGMAGLFCVRSGELDWPGDRGSFWTELKKLLAGVPEGLERLRERAHQAAGLTATGRLSDVGNPGRKTRLADLKTRLQGLRELKSRLDQAARRELKISEAEKRVGRLELAKRARIAALSEELGETRRRLRELPVIPEPRLDRWSELERGARGLREEIERREAAAREARERRGGLEERLAPLLEGTEDRQSRLRCAEERRLDERARQATEERDRMARLAALAALALPGGALLVGASLLLGLLMAAGALPSRYSLLAAGLLIGLLALGLGIRRRGRRLAWRERERALLEEAADLSPGIGGPEEVPGTLRRLEGEVRERQIEIVELRTEIRTSGEREAEERAGGEEARRRLEEALAEARKLAAELEVKDHAEAEELARARRREEDKEGRLVSALTELAGAEPAAWRVEPPRDPDLPEWDPRALEEARRELQAARASYEELRNEFLRRGLEAPEDVLAEELDVTAEIQAIQREAEAGRLAGEIFGTLDRALEAQLDRVLEDERESGVRGSLERITGRYRAVRRDPEGTLHVLDAGDRSFPLDRLSRGARDQVYLALRIGLAAAALRAAGAEESGFFLLDDPFLTADWGRRGRLVEVCRDLCGAGWQIIYLTCDDHLRDLVTAAGGKLHRL